MTCIFKRFLFALLLPLGFGLLAGGNTQAASVQAIYSFCANYQNGTCLDGEAPLSRLLQIGDEFYGTTSAGTLSKFQYVANSKTGYGNIFKISSDGTFASVYDFCQQNECFDGAVPGSFLAHGKDGLIYGISLGGGKLNAGTVFKMTVAGKLTTIYRFCAKTDCADGIGPVSVLFDANGVLFGTTSGGGANGSGTVFMINSSGTLRTLHSFCSQAGCDDGVTPGALVLGKDGNFYGTTSAGGTQQSGTIFRITPTGTFTRLYSMCSEKNCTDGANPNGRLIEGKDGNFYGTTVQGGANHFGVVFKVTPTGTESVVHVFCSKTYCDDGETPLDGLALAADGTFYGTTFAGGRFYSGVLFHLTDTGGYAIVRQFCATAGCFDGAAPVSSPILGTDGYLYGTTLSGGDKNNVGVVYRVKP